MNLKATCFTQLIHDDCEHKKPEKKWHVNDERAKMKIKLKRVVKGKVIHRRD